MRGLPPHLTEVRPLHLALAGVALLLLWSSVYTVSETEQVIRTQFGRPVGGVVSKPGLHHVEPLVTCFCMFISKVGLPENPPDLRSLVRQGSF